MEIADNNIRSYLEMNYVKSHNKMLLMTGKVNSNLSGAISRQINSDSFKLVYRFVWHGIFLKGHGRQFSNKLQMKQSIREFIH